MTPIEHPDLGNALTGKIIGAAIDVHRDLGPGLDEADYERVLSLELNAVGVAHLCQVPVPVLYKGVKLDCGYRMDIVVPGRLVLELKAIDKLHPVHEAQLLTYLRLGRLPLGLLINFGGLMLKDSIKRRANTVPQEMRLPFKLTGSTMDALSQNVIESAIEVHRHLGTGLLRSAYEISLQHELRLRGLDVECNLPIEINHRDQLFCSNKHLPFLIENRLLLNCYCVEEFEPIHLAKARSLLKASPAEFGLCINFHASSLAGNIKRISVCK